MKKLKFILLILLATFLLYFWRFSYAIPNGLLAYYYSSKSNKALLIGDYETTEYYLLKIYDIFNGDQYTTQLLASFYFDTVKNYPKALEYYENLQHIEDDQDSFYHLAMSYLLVGDFSNSEITFLRYLQRYPTDDNAIFNLAFIYYSIYDLEKALPLFENAYKLNNDCKTSAYLIDINLLLNNYEKANQYCRELIKCTPNELTSFTPEKNIFEFCNIEIEIDIDENIGNDEINNPIYKNITPALYLAILCEEQDIRYEIANKKLAAIKNKDKISKSQLQILLADLDKEEKIKRKSLYRKKAVTLDDFLEISKMPEAIRRVNVYIYSSHNIKSQFDNYVIRQKEILNINEMIENNLVTSNKEQVGN